MSARPLSSVLKCLDLLGAVATLNRPARLADIARLCGESRATTYQRLLTLSLAGWLEKLPDGTWRLTLRAARLANAALAQAGLGDRAQAILQALTEATGHTSSLVMLEEERAVIAQRVEARGVLRVDLRTGAELSFAESGSGRVWCAFGPADLVPRLLKAGVETPSPDIITAVRRDGHAICGGGRTLRGIGVVAAPALSVGGACMASLSLVGPQAGFDGAAQVDALKAAAAEVATLLAA